MNHHNKHTNKKDSPFLSVNFRREFLPNFVKKFIGKKNMKVVEIGVREGYYADRYYSVLKNVVSDFYLVDLWESESNDNYHSTRESIMKLSCERVQQIYDSNPQVHICKGDSLEWAKKFDNEYFDWIYIDADHTREAVLKDIKAWYPKLKKGGVISGHDAYPHPADTELLRLFDGFDVEGAVEEYFEKKSNDVYVTNERNYKSWFYLKGEVTEEKKQLINFPKIYFFLFLILDFFYFVKKVISAIFFDRDLIYRRSVYLIKEIWKKK